VLVGNILELLDLPTANEVSIINTVPSAMNELVRLDGVPVSATTICLAGEPLTAALAEAIYRLPQVTQLYNLYGPSEDTTYSTWALVPREAGATVTIGRPIANTQAFVLDPDMQPTPIGIPGELYLGGDGLAREYLHRPELTAERFVENPFARDSNSRLYRTGDLVKYLPDGQLLFLGRLDHQVKIRGFRIELGEIQTLLERHDDVTDAAVVVREDVPGDKRIVAYVVTGPGCGPEVLRNHLAEFVPQYMVPSSFVFLDALPRTPNGKLDRKALPAPAAADSGGVDEAVCHPLESRRCAPRIVSSRSEAIRCSPPNSRQGCATAWGATSRCG
jgi:acyl-coenzyme A synthetase/AMP-(fatty) acid ligase